MLQIADKSIQNKYKLNRINHVDVFHMKHLPSFRLLESQQDGAIPVKILMASEMQSYLEIYHSGTNSQLVADEFVDLIFAQYYGWNVLDIIAFINFIKLNKPNTSGHKISPSELIQSVMEYESGKIELMEQEHQNNKFTKIEFGEFKGSKVLDVWLEARQKKAQDKLDAINESVKKANEIRLRRDAKLKELKKRIALNEISEDDAMDDWNNFLKTNT